MSVVCSTQTTLAWYMCEYRGDSGEQCHFLLRACVYAHTPTGVKPHTSAGEEKVKGVPRKNQGVCGHSVKP